MTTNSNKQWLVNKLTTGLLLKNGYIDLPIGGSIVVAEADLEDETIKYALNLNWAELTNKEPAAPVAASAVEVTIHKPNNGISAAELQALNAAKATEPEAETSTVTALGVEETPVAPDAPAEAETETPAEAPKKGKAK